MERRHKNAAFLLSLSLLLGTGASPGVAAAAEERSKITDVTLYISAELGNDSDFSDMFLQITAGSGNYSLGSYEITNDTGNSSYPTIQVSLDADSGYYFDVSSKNIHLEGEEADCTSKSTDKDKDTLVLKIKLTDLTANLNPVASADLDSDGEGNWSSVPGAKKYELRLYRGSTMVGSSKTTSNTEYDFSNMITRKGDYFFKVRAIGHNSSDKSDWTSSNSYYFDDALSSSSSWSDDWWWYDGPTGYGYPGGYGPDGPGNSIYYNAYTAGGPGEGSGSGSGSSSGSGSGWKQDSKGWWYRNSNGSYPANKWQQINGSWYHFDNSGYMQTGWLSDNGRLFYLSPNNDSSQGKMITGWHYISGKYYYFNPNSDGTQGALVTDTVIDGKYRVGSDGALIP